MKPVSSSSQDPSMVNYQSEDEIHDSVYQVLWSHTMDKGKYKNSSNYKKVEALLLCWKEECNDLANTDKEVNRLKSVLEGRFKYNVSIECLDSNVAGRLQVQLNALVATFVMTHDGPNTLLIVYYGGHGRPGPLNGHLQLLGKTSPNDPSKRLDTIIWNQTEELLKPAEADVLELFDCCYAGTVGLTKGPSRLFEYLAATKAMGLTRVPGRDSFTSALIFALESLVTKQPEGRFTTIDLVNEIKEHAPYFPNDQEPVLSDRQDYSCAGRIMLQPLQKDGSKPESPRTKEGPDPANRHTVTLHLDFSEKPSNFNVERLGTELNDVFERNKFLGVSRVRWGGMRSVQAMVTRAARTFMLNVERNRSKRQLTPLNLSSANNGWLSPNPTSPIPMSPDIRQLSSSPTNMHSPQPQMQSFAVTGSLLINTPDYNSESNLKLTRFNGSSEGHHQDNRKRPRCSLEDE